MPYKIITYETPEQLMHPNSAFATYKNAIHITATNSLKNGIEESNNELCRWIDGEVIAFSELARAIGGGWFSATTELLQYTRLSEMLRHYSESEFSMKRELHGAFDKNQESLLATIRFLRESGIHAARLDAMVGKSAEEEALRFVYHEMEKSGLFKDFDDWSTDFNQKTIETFATSLVWSLTKSSEESNHHEMNRRVHRSFTEAKVIVLHGFYFLMPIQKMLFDRLSEQIDVVHVVNRASGYSKGFEPVERFLEMDQHPHIPALDDHYPVNQNAKRFLDALNGKFEEERVAEDGEREVQRYSNLYQFRMHAKVEDHVLISPRAEVMKGYMEEIGQSAGRQLSRYPFGRFLLDVHSLNIGRYDVPKGEYGDEETLTTERVQRIFQSGFLIVDGIPATECLLDLRRLSPLLEGQHSFEEWRETLNGIKRVRERVHSELGSSYISTLDQRLHGAPYEAIGHLSVDEDGIDSVLSGINAIEELYTKLFASERVIIKDYVKLLDDYVQIEILPHLQYESDRKIAVAVRDALADLKDGLIDIVERRDLTKGLNFFLGGKAHEDEYAEEMQSGSQSDGNRVQQMLNSDGIQFAMNRNIHFCLMDQKSFPHPQSLNLWPLRKESSDELFEENLNLRQLALKKELEFEIACYLFYILMCNAVHLKFSFVENMRGEKKLSSSYYLDLMGLSTVSPHRTLQSVDEEEPEDAITIQHKILHHRRAYTILLHSTYMRCKRRAMYSFLVNDRPVFESDFHGGFTFQNLLHFAQETVEASSEERFNLISEAFPHLTDLKKKMHRSRRDSSLAQTRYSTGYTYVDGIKYKDKQLNLTLFGEKRAEEAYHPFRDERFELVGPIAEPGKHCMYCPYQNICRDSQIRAME